MCLPISLPKLSAPLMTRLPIIPFSTGALGQKDRQTAAGGRPGGSIQSPCGVRSRHCSSLRSIQASMLSDRWFWSVLEAFGPPSSGSRGTPFALPRPSVPPQPCQTLLDPSNSSRSGQASMSPARRGKTWCPAKPALCPPPPACSARRCPGGGASTPSGAPSLLQPGSWSVRGAGEKICPWYRANGLLRPCRRGADWGPCAECRLGQRLPLSHPACVRDDQLCQQGYAGYPSCVMHPCQAGAETLLPARLPPRSPLATPRWRQRSWITAPPSSPTTA